MTEQEQNSQNHKTVVAFIAGLLVGGLLVWVFGAGPSAEAPDTRDNDQIMEDENNDSANDDSDMDSAMDLDLSSGAEANSTTDQMEVGEGELVVNNQVAGDSVALSSATFPSNEGWVGVREYTNGNMGNILGVARFSKGEGLVPTEVSLLRPTESGKTYAVVFFTENGDMEFSLATDVQVGSVSTTFVAQ